MTAARTLVSLFLFALVGLAAVGLDRSVQAAPAADLTANRTMWLGQCDASCGFHDAAWLANENAVVAGYALDYDDLNCPASRACRSMPQILMYDFTRRSMMIFQGPGVPAGPRHDYTVGRVREKLPQVTVYY